MTRKKANDTYGSEQKRRLKNWIKPFSLSLVVLTVFAFSFLLPGCSLIQGSEKNATSAQLQEGMILLNDVELDFGENSVSDASLSEVDLDGTTQPEGLLSTLYELEMDSICTEQVCIRMEFENSDTADQDNLYLGLGSKVELSDGTVETLYHFVPAQFDEGILTAAFVPSDYINLSVNGNTTGSAATPTPTATPEAASITGDLPSQEEVEFGIFSCNSSFSDGGHFTLYYYDNTLLTETERNAVLTDLEKIYAYYLGKGYTYSKRTDWPMDVMIQTIKDSGKYSFGWAGHNGSIYLNVDHFENKEYQAGSLLSLLSHEFFHFVQFNYSSVGSDCLWFDEATSCYFEYLNSGSAIPSITTENYEHLMNSALPNVNTSVILPTEKEKQRSAKDIMDAEGYGRMPLMLFLANRESEEFIRYVYEQAAAGTDWETAIINTVGDPSTWAGDYYQDLITGEISDIVAFSYHLNLEKYGSDLFGKSLALNVPNESELVTIIEGGNTPQLGYQTVSVGSTGAQLVALTIDEENVKRLTDGVVPVIKVSGGRADVRVISIDGRNTTVIKGTEESIQLKDFKNAVSNNTRYFVLITGLHESGMQDYEVTVELNYPTLDELVGEYPGSTLTFTDIFISDNLKKEAENEDNELGCDLEMLASLEELEGQTRNITMVIEKTGDNSGTLQIILNENSSMDPMPFTYACGLLKIEYQQDDYKYIGFLNAIYGTNNDVVISGGLTGTSLKIPDDFQMDLELMGSKALPAA